MARMTGVKALFELFRQEGIDTIFGNPGTTELPLIDGLSDETDIRYVVGLNEMVVMGMADGYAQASGRLAVANLHAAPGLGNALGMLFDAMKAAAPILVTAGQQDQTFALTEPNLWGELTVMARPYVKWSYEVRRIEDLPMAIHRAAKTALAPPTGPVFVALPTDVMMAEAELDLGHPTRIGTALRGDADAVADAAQLMAAAERPVIIAGDAVAQSRGLAALVALAEALAAPVYLEGMANTAAFPSSHRLFAGTIPRLSPQIKAAMAKHDLLVSVGADLFTLSMPGALDLLPAGMKLVHLDTDPWELGKSYPADAAILGSPAATLPDLVAALVAAQSPDHARAAAQRRARIGEELVTARADLRAKARAIGYQIPIPPVSVLQVIAEGVPPDAVIVDEAISSGAGFRELLASDDAQSFFGNRGGGIGWGLPAAVGVKLALPERPVVAVIGDGSSLYTCQALWSAAHQRAKVVFVILNNRSYRILKQRVTAMRSPARRLNTMVGLDLSDPAIDFVSLARGFGVPAGRATTLAEFADAFAQALADAGPSLIDVVVDAAY